MLHVTCSRSTWCYALPLPDLAGAKLPISGQAGATYMLPVSGPCSWSYMLPIAGPPGATVHVTCNRSTWCYALPVPGPAEHSDPSYGSGHSSRDPNSNTLITDYSIL